MKHIYYKIVIYNLNLSILLFEFTNFIVKRANQSHLAVAIIKKQYNRKIK